MTDWVQAWPKPSSIAKEVADCVSEGAEHRAFETEATRPTGLDPAIVMVLAGMASIHIKSQRRGYYGD